MRYPPERRKPDPGATQGKPVQMIKEWCRIAGLLVLASAPRRLTRISGQGLVIPDEPVHYHDACEGDSEAAQ